MKTSTMLVMEPGTQIDYFHWLAPGYRNTPVQQGVRFSLTFTSHTQLPSRRLKQPAQSIKLKVNQFTPADFPPIQIPLIPPSLASITSPPAAARTHVLFEPRTSLYQGVPPSFKEIIFGTAPSPPLACAPTYSSALAAPPPASSAPLLPQAPSASAPEAPVLAPEATASPAPVPLVTTPAPPALSAPAPTPAFICSYSCFTFFSICSCSIWTCSDCSCSSSSCFSSYFTSYCSRPCSPTFFFYSSSSSTSSCPNCSCYSSYCSCSSISSYSSTNCSCSIYS